VKPGRSLSMFQWNLFLPSSGSTSKRNKKQTLLSANFFIGLLLELEDTGNMVLRNVGGFPQDYTALHLRKLFTARSPMGELQI
jgi:hypothetical protein